MNLEKEQGDFIQDTGTRYALFMSGMLPGETMQMQTRLYLTFIDHTKAFDKVRYLKY